MTDQCLTTRHTHPDAQVGIAGLAHSFTDTECGPDCALGVVLVRRGRSEHCHHPITSELHDPPTRPFHLRSQHGKVRREEALHILDIELLGPTGEPG